MSLCHNQQKEQERPPFITTLYSPDEYGDMVACIPDSAPCGVDGSTCCIREHSSRDRKTGPGFPLVIVMCLDHRKYFTLYPPGFTPYGRAPVAPVAPQGRACGPDDEGIEPWVGTLFEAAVLATPEKVERCIRASCRPHWPTLHRQVQRSAVWLGLDGSLRTGEKVAGHLDVGLSVHSKARQGYATAEGMRGRAACVVAVLEAVPDDALLLHRMLRAGHAAGVLGRVWWWRPGRGYRQPFS